MEKTWDYREQELRKEIAIAILDGLCKCTDDKPECYIANKNIKWAAEVALGEV